MRAKIISVMALCMCVAACSSDDPASEPLEDTIPNKSQFANIEIPSIEYQEHSIPLDDTSIPLGIEPVNPQASIGGENTSPESHDTPPEPAEDKVIWPDNEPPVCPNPTACDPVADLSIGHGEPVVTFQYNPDLNDSISVWAQDMGGIINCVESGESFSHCVEQSNATDDCKSAFSQLTYDNNGAEIIAFEVAFLNKNGPCTPHVISAESLQ